MENMVEGRSFEYVIGTDGMGKKNTVIPFDRVSSVTWSNTNPKGFVLRILYLS